MDGPILFTREVRKQVFDFFSNILREFTDPVYYEYIRGHVSKAPLPVRKYVASKLKGEKLLDYFRLRKNYFIVEGTDVVLKKDPKGKKVQSKCVVASGVSRERKISWKSDRASRKRSFSCSSNISDYTVASSCVSSINVDENLEHEDYVNKYFYDLVIRHEKADLSLLYFDDLPKKVRRHLDLYYKRKVANYFAHFPDKYVIDGDGKVALNLHHADDSNFITETKSVDTIPPLNSASDNSPVTLARKKSPDPNDREIQLVLLHTDTILFFIDILTKKNATLTVQQLGGYLSQAPKELRSFLKFNYKNFKNFFEETSYIFLINSCEEVKLSNFSRYHKSGVEKIRKIAIKASYGDISVQTMRDKIDELRNKIKTLFSDKNSDVNIKSNSEIIAEASPNNDTVQQITENQQESSCETTEVDSIEPNCPDKKINEQTDSDTFNVAGNVQAELVFNIPKVIEKLQVDYDYCGLSTDNIVFEINGNLYEPNGNLYEGKANLYGINCNHYEGNLSTKDDVNGDSKMIVKVAPAPCTEHKKFQIPCSEYLIDADSLIDCQSEKFYEEKTYKFLLMIELFCLEMTEKNFDFTANHEVKAIQYFIEVLEQPILKSRNVSSLHGTLGKASAEVSSFINKKYKISNFLSFFQIQPEFEVDSSMIKLSTTYKETFARRIKALSVSANRNSKWDLIKLYDSVCYKNILTEIFSLFLEICRFLKNKKKTKLSRLEGIVTRFPNCLDWIKALEEETVIKKTRRFLHLFDIFEFPSDDYISFESNYFNKILLIWFENTHLSLECPNRKINLMSIFHDLKNQFITSPAGGKFDINIGQLSGNFIIEAIKSKLPLKYHELVATLPEHLLHKIIESGISSRSFIEALLKDGQYFLQNGKIVLKTDEHDSFDLDSVDNNLIEVQKFKSQEKVSNKSEVSPETSNRLVSNNEINEETNPDDYSNSKSTSSIDLSLVSSIDSTPVDISLSPTSIKVQKDSTYNNQLQLLDSECVNCNSQIVSSEVQQISSIGNKKSLEMSPLKEDADNTDLTVPLRDHIEKVTEDSITKSLDSSFDVVRYETCYQVSCENMIKHEDDFGSSVEDIESLIALGEKHSLSSLENEDLVYSDEENSHGSIEKEANKCVADAKYEDYISYQIIDESEKENIDAGSRNLNNIEKVTTEKYLELLKIDEVLDIADEVDTNQKNASSDEKALNEAFSRDLNYSKNKMELPVEPEVTDILKDVSNRTDFTKIIENESITGNISEMKFKAELLAKEFFQDKIHKILSSKIFVASTKVLFEVKKNYLREAYGPFDSKTTDKSIYKNYNHSKTVPNPTETRVSLQNSNSVKSTANKDVYHNKDIPVKDIFQDKSVSMNNAAINPNVNLHDSKDIFIEFPLQEKLNSANDKDKSVRLNSSNGNEFQADHSHVKKSNSKKDLNSIENLKSDDFQSVSNDYPLQPISAEIVLLTSDSCIAIADINSHKQNIYFLKCVFACDDQYCCSTCFNDLKVGDIVSCFVPPTEISRKMWIAFMVSKETGSQFNEIDSFNEVIIKQSKDSMDHNMCVNSKNVLIQTENSSAELGCQVEYMLTEKTSQTRLSGDVKLCAITEDSMCQINSTVKTTSSQTVNEINSSECQTEINCKIDMESQTNHTGDLNEISVCAEMSSQTDLSGKVRALINFVESECQTISTGQVMITKYYHL